MRRDLSRNFEIFQSLKLPSHEMARLLQCTFCRSITILCMMLVLMLIMLMVLNSLMMLLLLMKT